MLTLTVELRHIGVLLLHRREVLLKGVQLGTDLVRRGRLR